MRGVQTLNTAAGVVNIGDAEFIKAGQRVFIGAKDSVATATLSVKFAGVEVATGPIAIESGTDMFRWPDDIVSVFKAKMDGQLTVTLGGTVAGCRLNLLIMNADEPQPW